MNKSAIVARVAARMGVDKFMAEGAVDSVLAASDKGLAKVENVRVASYGTLRSRGRSGIHERRELGDTFEAEYRQSGLLDRFLSFDVGLAEDHWAGH